MKDTTLFYLFIFIVSSSSLLLSVNSSSSCVSSSSPRIRRAQFTNDSYTGYISENLNQQQETAASGGNFDTTTNPELDKWRRNVLSTVTKPSVVIYVRFVDRIKPSLLVYLDPDESNASCSCLTSEQVNLNLLSSSLDYDQDGSASSPSDALFQVEQDSILCVPNADEEQTCLCYFHIKLSDDPMTRDRLNREARDSYKFQVAAFNTTAYINLQILDDNDLEPMFDPTEYSIELTKYTLTERTIIRNQVPQFTQIGRLSASDPDLDANALTRYFLSTPHALFGVDWLTGAIYTKRPITELFEHPNHWSSTLEAKTIDNGLKYSTLNTLIRLNPNITVMNEASLSVAASQLHFNSSLLKQLPKLASFESAQVRVTLVSNLADLYKVVFSGAELDDDVDLVPSSDLKEGLIPFKILRISFKSPFSLPIDPKSNLRLSYPLKLTQISTRSFLISFDPNLEVSESVRIEYCLDSNDVCHPLVDFTFNSTQAIVETLQRTCIARLEATPKQVVRINRLTSLQNLLRVRSTIEPAYCKRLSLFYSHNDSSLVGNIDEKSGLVSLRAYQSGSFLVYPVVYYQNRRFSLAKSVPIHIDVRYSTRFDHLYNILVNNVSSPVNEDESATISDRLSSQVDLIRLSVDLNRTNVLFESNSQQTRIVKMLYCSVNRPLQKCPVYIQANRLEVVPGIQFRSANVLVKLYEHTSNSSRYVNLLAIVSGDSTVVNVEHKDIYPVLIARPSDEEIDSGEFSLAENEHESSCFYVNRTSGSIYMSCLDEEFIQTVLSVTLRRNDIISSANLRVELSRNGESPLVYYPFTESVLDDQKVAEIIKNEEQLNLDSIRSFLYPISTDYDANTTVISLNQSHVVLNWTIEYQLPIVNSRVYRLESAKLFSKSSSVFLIESIDSSYLRLDNIHDGVIYLATDLNGLEKKIEARLGVTETSLTRRVTRHDVNLEIHVNVVFGKTLRPPKPMLKTNEIEATVDRLKLDKSGADFEVVSAFEWTDLSGGVFTPEFEIKSDYVDYDFPFYLQHSRLVFSNSMQRNLKPVYRFRVVARFKPSIKELSDEEDEIELRIRLVNFDLKRKVVRITNDVEVDEKTNHELSIISRIDMSMAISSASLFSYMKSPIIGFVSKKSPSSHYKLLLAEPPTSPSSKKTNKQTSRNSNKNSRSAQSIVDVEQKLLHDNLLRFLNVDESTGALYLNISEQSGLFLYSKWSKLRKFYLYERNLTAKLVRIDVQSDHHVKYPLYIELVFEKPIVDQRNALDFDSSFNHRNRFLINSNNLLNVFRHGDEFLLALSVDENSFTSSAADPIVNLMDYLRTSVMRNRKSALQFETIKDSLSFYLMNQDDSYFSLEGNSSILVTKPNIQFDYEQQSNYHLKILVVQPVETDQQQQSMLSSNDDLIFASNQADEFHYYIDLHMAVRNQIDEPFMCSQPVYTVSIDENEAKPKPIFTVDILDFDSISSSFSTDRYSVQIVSSTHGGLFSASGLTISTTGRKLDREARDRYVLDLKVTDRTLASNSSRQALCRLIVLVNDVNDNRPIVNDIELSLYDRVDLDIPVANAIAIDQDSVSVLTYSVISVRDLEDEATNLDSLFVMNASSGSLFATQPQLPCFDCTIQITYKATDVGQGSKTRVSRKSAIKLHVRKFPSSLMRINPQTSSTEIIESVAKTFTVIGSIESNSTRQLELDEDTKLGEKIHQIRVESSGRLLNAADSIVYFTLVEESNTNGTFYLSNHDGSLYLIKKLTANQRFNLTVLITNWLGQIEYVPVEVTVRDVNDNEPEFESSPVFNVSTEIAIESASGYKVVALTRLYDLDEVDREKLSIKTDACFYLGRGLLIKKQLFNYPLCDSKSLRLDLDPTGLVSATINLDELSRFLHNSTDFFNSRSRFDPSIVFYLDLSARDSSTDLSRKTLSRARFEIVLKRPPRQLVYKKRHIVGINSNRRQIMFGFKQPVYRIELNEVVTDRELIRLGNEFVWTSGSNTSNFYSFKPFELQFESTNNLVYVEPNFGLVYLNETARSEFLIDVEIRCRVLRPPTASLSANDDDVTLYPTTRLIISVRGDDERESEVEALLRRRIWRSNSIEARLAENSPVGSFLNFDSVASLSELLFDETFDLIPKFEYSVVYSTLDSELFEVEPITGVIRAKFEPDFETQSVYDLKLRVCLERDEQTLRCFKHELEIQVKISNRNDNEPRFTLEQDEKTTITLLSPVELFRSMTLFKFNAFDLDDEETDENKLDFELIHAKLGNSSILDWFDLFTSNHSGGIKLTDLGYERLTKPSSNPQETIELIVETSDGLFSNRLSFHVNVNRLDSSSRRTSRSNTSPNHLAPILLNLEVEEESTTSKLLVPSLHQTLTEYLNVEPDSFVAFFDLLNYETEFRIDDDDHALWVRSTARLDREARDNYELFIRPRVLFAAKHVEHMPAQFRVLVKLADVNDNAPKFVGIESLDKTLLWTDFVQSTRLKPVLKIRAVDADLADKLTYHIDYSTTQLDIFQVDEHTGALYVSEQAQEDLDSVWNMHSSNNNLVTRVGILARDTASHETNRTLKLHLVRFVDPHHVVGFEQTRYEFEIVESAVANTTIGFVNSARFFSPSLTARNDSSSIIYELIDGDDLYDEFGLDYETGRLYTRGDLDYELKPNYTLVVRARSAFGGGLSHSNATIHVRVIDCNDNAPRFDRFEYNTSVKENLAPMTKIYRVEARDADSNGSLNSQVRYKLLNQLDLFYIHEKSGWVYNKMPFDSSASSSREYLLKIQAYDIGSVYSPEHKWKAKSLSSVAHLIVHIEESNTERPQFDKSLYTSQIELALNSRGVQFVTKLSAKDTDHSPLSYSIRSPQPWPHNLFSIDSRTGVVYLDVERYNRFSSASNSPSSSVFNLIVSASDSVFTQTARLNVHVRNSAAKSTTLQPPRFYSSLIDLVFVNSTDVRSFLRRHHSRYDEDIIELSIDPSTMFFLDGTRLTLSTVNSHRLNSSQLYQLPLLACSRVHSTLCDQTLLVVNITLAVNHTDDSAAIKPSADSLLTLEDYAKNVGFSYQYGAYTIQQHISAQTQSSSVTNKPINPVDYDYQNIEEDEDIYESNERFYFEFKTISDQQQQQQHHQQSEDLTGGDMKPYKLEFDLVQCVYMQLNLTLSNHSLAKQIRHFSHGKSYLPLTRAQIKTLFSLNRNNGVLSSRKVLNSMLPGVYLFTIALRLANRSTNATSTVEADRTQFKLIILPSTQSIANSNQTSNFYKFDREFYKFKANNLGHVRLINRLKSHANISFSTHKIRFRLIENKFSLRQRSMTIDERTGEIKLNTSMSGEETLETTEDSELVLYALATVDLAPTTRRNASVLNRLEYMCEIYIDRLSDNPLSSSLTSSSSSSTKPPLDTASAATSSVTEMRIVPSLVRLKLEETLERDVALFRFVTLLESVNERRAFIKYQIEGGAEESASFFEVEPKLGWLKLAKELDRRHLSRVVLNVSACIELQCAFSRVEIDVVDVNNHPPRFEQRVQEATIREDSLPGTVVATVLATDADTHSKLEYFILDGDPLNQFAVSSDGKVYTQLMLDRERSSEYYLEIGAFDGKYRSEMHLRVLILDVSDQRPICGPPNVVELNLDENLEIGTAVYTVKATNREENVTRLRYELIGREQVETGADNLVESYLEQIPFTVDESRGIVRVSDVLDYEHAISYEFYIRVCKSDLESDSTKNSRVLLPWTQYCLIRVRVDLNDVNDNAPEFLPSSLNRRVIDLVESSPRGTILTQFSASDADSKLNSVVRYELVDSLNMFEIAPKSGLLQLSASRLDREELPESAVNLTVRAYNVADRLSSLYEIEVNVVDLNDNAPRFDRAEYFISVEENLPTGFLLTQITAFDPDVNSTTEYEIVGDDGDSKFVLDKETGKLYLNGSLDYEQKQHYTLTISARDPYLAGEQSTTRLTIDLIDLNDNTPQFDPSTPSHFYVSENTPINTTIYHVMAYDADKSPLNSALSYRLLDDTQRLFGVDSDSGRLYIRDELDYEQLAATNISLTIECSDRGEPERRRAQLAINIVVLDVNDNAPQFERPNQTIIFKETFPIGQEITRFKVFDRDATEANRGPFTFELVDFDRRDSAFGVTANGSLVLTKRPLRNVTHFVKVRCHDSGSPQSLYTDSHLTIKITDESSNEPHVSDTQIEIVTLENTLSNHIKSGQILGQIRAWDADKQDTLYYELDSNRAIDDHTSESSTKTLEIDRLTGLLKSTRPVEKSTNIRLKTIVTDTKFISEANLNVNVRAIHSQCLLNSLYVKFAHEKSDSTFIQLGYIRRLKEVLSRLMSSQLRISSANATRYDIIVLAMRDQELDSTALEGLDLDDDIEPQSDNGDMNGGGEGKIITEVLFSVTKFGPQSSHCLNSKQVAKLLNKRKPMLLKRLKTGDVKSSSSFKQIKLVDLSFNHECANSQSSDAKICTTNMALQQCRLRFSGEFNTIPSLGVFDSCENTTQGSMHCYVLPRYDWSCSSSSSDSSSGNIDEDEGSDSWPHSSTKSATKTSTSVVSVFGAGQLCKPHHNPCKNNAICRQVKLTSANKSNSTTTNKLRVQCHCPLGFRGKLCEEDIDECAVTGDNNEQPVCAQSATCINTYGSYICNCSLEPPTLCYNTLSSKFSASVVDLKHVGALRGHTIKNIGGDSSSSGLDQSGNEEYAKLTLLGYSVPVAVVQQALLGIFGGICALLIILSIAAAVVCRVNMSSRRTRSRDHRYSAAALKSTSTTAAVSSGSSSCGGAGSGGLAATTTATESNTSGDHEDLFLSSSASASPGSDAFKHHKQTPSSAAATVKVTVEKSSTKQSSKSTNRFKRSTKQRSSMTASLISTHTNDSQYDNTPYNQRKSKSKQQQQQRKQTSKYTINNLLFSTKREEVGGKKSSTSPILELNEMKQPTTAASSSSLAEEETASGGEEAASSSSSSSTYDNSPNRAKMSTSRLSQHQHNDIVETVCLLEKTTNDVNRVENLLAGTTNTASNNNFSSFGRNINKPNGTGSNYAQMKMTQLKRIRVETGADDSMNAEDCSQGYYYWDVTDWTGNEPAEIQINKSLNLSTNSPYSPLYSKVFKVNSSTRDNRSELFEELIQPTTSNGNYDELSNYQVDETTEKLDLIKLRQNYLYLANRDDEVEESETAT